MSLQKWRSATRRFGQIWQFQKRQAINILRFFKTLGEPQIFLQKMWWFCWGFFKKLHWPCWWALFLLFLLSGKFSLQRKGWVCPLPYLYFLKEIWWYLSMFCSQNLPCYECSKGHVACDMLHTLNTQNMFTTCITWIQNMFRYHNLKTNGSEGRLSKKARSSTFCIDCRDNLGVI